MAELHQIEGDVFDAFPRLSSSWAHGCVTDPPYGWGFMGRDFDRQHRDGAFDALLDEQATFAGWLTAAERKARGVRRLSESERYVLWSLAWLREIHRVLVPGALAMIFQGSKSYDLTAYAARLAGFEVLPMVCGITGQAMAQGGNLGKLIDREAGAEREVVGTTASRSTGRPRGLSVRDFDGHSTRIRDQLFPVLVAMKPTEGSFAANARRWGVAGFDVDGCRVEAASWDAEAMDRCNSPRSGRIIGQEISSSYGRRPSGPLDVSSGRYPGNALLDDAAAEEVGEMAGERPGRPARGALDGTGSGSGAGRSYRTGGSMVALTGYEDVETSAARYFRRFRYIARAPKPERMRGLETWHWVGDKDHPEGWRRVGVEEWQYIPKRRQMVGSNHPTLKALDFTRWAARLILPPAGPEASAIREETTGSRSRVLVPFSGVLSEAIGCALAGWSDVVAIESSASYVAQGWRRWEAWGPYSEERAAEVERARVLVAVHSQGELFVS